MALLSTAAPSQFAVLHIAESSMPAQIIAAQLQKNKPNTIRSKPAD
jgi:hypothetical protein